MHLYMHMYGPCARCSRIDASSRIYSAVALSVCPVASTPGSALMQQERASRENQSRVHTVGYYRIHRRAGSSLSTIQRLFPDTRRRANIVQTHVPHTRRVGQHTEAARCMPDKFISGMVDLSFFLFARKLCCAEFLRNRRARRASGISRVARFVRIKNLFSFVRCRSGD